MLSFRDKNKIINIIEEILGSGTKTKGNNHSHFCPFCNHHKKKLEVDVESQQWHCWVCDAKGKTLYSLFRKLDVGKHKIAEINKIYGNDYVTTSHDAEVKTELRLPKEFKTALTKPKTFNPMYTNVKHYLKSRNITREDIIKYNIGYCDSGLYEGRIIIPSYTSDNQLNYFISRTIYEDETYKYKNPPASKNVIALDSQINWNEPITIVEGIFDAIAVKRNAIPIFGKVIPKVLMEKILIEQPSAIKIMLDVDAQKQALHYTDFFTKQGFPTSNIVPTDKDAGEMGFSEANKTIQNTKITTFTDIISQKLNLK